MAFTVSPGGRRACNAEADQCRNRRGKSDRCAHRPTLSSFSLFIGASSSLRSFLVAPFVMCPAGTPVLAAPDHSAALLPLSGPPTPLDDPPAAADQRQPPT